MSDASYSTKILVWAHQDLNLGPAGYEPAALNRAELWARAKSSIIRLIYQVWGGGLSTANAALDAVAAAS